MSEAVLEQQDSVALVPATHALADLAVNREPGIVLAEAQRAAAALKDVISRKPKQVKFNGEQYLEFEDWQTVARFYGLTARVQSTRYVEYGEAQGFEACADVLCVPTGQVLTAAESMCLNDEPTWSRKPLYQLRSMAQTRACAKALRNVLSWVVVLAGYRPTPAEEMQPQDSNLTRDLEASIQQAQAKRKKPFDKYAFLAEIKKLKTRYEAIREVDAYYSILAEFGAKHSNEITDPGKAVACYKRLSLDIGDREARVAAEKLVAEIDADAPMEDVPVEDEPVDVAQVAEPESFTSELNLAEAIPGADAAQWKRGRRK
jgi:hypothetical protein